MSFNDTLSNAKNEIEARIKNFGIKDFAIERPVHYIKEGKIKKNVVRTQREISPFTSTKAYEYLNLIMDHLCSGSSESKRKLFDDIMVYPDETVINDELLIDAFHDYVNESTFNEYKKSLRRECDTYVNANKRCVELFVKYLCHCANLNKEGSHKDNSNKKIFFLNGDYGSGKTFFVNYILSTFQNIFEEKNIITIKIDLSATHQQAGSIIEKLCRQLLKILRRKYFHKPSWGDFNERLSRSEFIRYLDEYSSSSNLVKELLKKEIDRVDAESNSIVSDYLLEDAVRELVDFINNKNYNSNKKYKFLFVIDGLDNYNRDQTSGTLFKERIREIEKKIIRNNNDNLFLLVSRTESYFEIINRIHKGEGGRLGPMKTIFLFPVDIKKILKSRIDKMKELYSNNTLSFDEDFYFFDEIDIKISDFIASKAHELNKFIWEYLEKVFLDENKNCKLIEFFSGNTRELINCYKICLKIFLSYINFYAIADKHSDYIHSVKGKMNMILDNNNGYNLRSEIYNRYHYLLYDGLIINEYMIHENIYNLVCGKEGRYYSDKAKELNNGPVVSNLFQICKEIIHDNEDRGCVPYMAKIRILQYFSFLKRTNSGATFKQVSVNLNKWFDFNENYIYGMCHMLYSEQCIKRCTSSLDEYRVYDEETGKFLGIFEISDRGLYMINNMLMKYEYIFNLLDDIYVYEPYAEFKFKDWKILTDEYKKLIRNVSVEQLKSSLGDIKLKVLYRTKWLIDILDFYKEVESKQSDYFKIQYESVHFSFDKNIQIDDLKIVENIRKACDKTISRQIKKYESRDYSQFVADYFSKYLGKPNPA